MRTTLGYSAFRHRLRQYRFPPEFRILEPGHYAAVSPPEAAAEPAPPQEPSTEPDPAAGMDDAAVADIATRIWRIRKRYAADPGGVPREQRIVARNVDAISDRLDTAGVRVKDHDGTAFDIGLELRVLAYEPRAGTERETIVETVEPSVYRAGRCIQIGQVIVGTPEEQQHNVS